MNLWMSCLIYGSEDGRSKAAVTHLALARSQNTRNGILGFSQKRIISYKSKTDLFCMTQKIKYQNLQKKLQEKLQLLLTLSGRSES